MEQNFKEEHHNLGGKKAENLFWRQRPVWYSQGEKRKALWDFIQEKREMCCVIEGSPQVGPVEGREEIGKADVNGGSSSQGYWA